MCLRAIVWILVICAGIPWRESWAQAGGQDRAVVVPRDSIRRDSVRRAQTLQTLNISGERNLGDAFQPRSVLEGAQLDRMLGSSIAATIASQPGVTQRFNGPMAAQPVIRGLSGDRVLLLEDGLRTGDIASTSPDHAITVDPLAVQRIEIIRGPAGLLYGTNTLGGVVNVIRDDVPRVRPFRRTFTFGSQAESMNRGATLFGSAVVPLPLGLVVRGEMAGRMGGDTRTPGGSLPYTDVRSSDASGGVAWIGDAFRMGASVRNYQAEYGVPSSFAGVTLPGSHLGGVYVDVHRTTGRADAEYQPGPGSMLRTVQLRGNYVRYEHRELERGGFIGTRFGQLAASGDVVARFARGRHSGALGAFAQWRDFRAVGSYTGTRPATLHGKALFGFHEVDLNPLSVMVGARYDRVRLTPLDSTESLFLPHVATRKYSALTATAGATFRVYEWLTAGMNIARAFRPPAIEELYSAGPHLASYAYEVGNPQLDAESGLGVDAFVRITQQRVRAEISMFDNHVRNFIRYAPVVDSLTGAPMRDPRIRRYVVYQAVQQNARLFGAEGTMEWDVRPGIVVEATANLVRGRDRSGAGWLPAMPADRVRTGVRRNTPRWFTGLHVERNFAHRRVPHAQLIAAASESESCVATVIDGEAIALPAEYCPTSGVTLVNGHVGMRWSAGLWWHSITVSADNALNTTWHDPLWRAKQVAPQPGRNIRVLYRVGS